MTETQTVLTFDSPVVLVGGVPDPAGLSNLPLDWPVISADGGVHAALQAGRVPLAVIGDMDSVEDLASLRQKYSRLNYPDRMITTLKNV